MTRYYFGYVKSITGAMPCKWAADGDIPIGGQLHKVEDFTPIELDEKQFFGLSLHTLIGLFPYNPSVDLKQ